MTKAKFSGEACRAVKPAPLCAAQNALNMHKNMLLFLSLPYPMPKCRDHGRRSPSFSVLNSNSSEVLMKVFDHFSRTSTPCLRFSSSASQFCTRGLAHCSADRNPHSVTPYLFLNPGKDFNCSYLPLT